MELPSTEGSITWEDAGQNIPDDMYKMTKFDEYNLEDGKPYVKNQPKDTTKTDRHAKSKAERSFFNSNKQREVWWRYDSDGENGPYIPETIMVKTVKEDDIVPTREQPPVAVTVMFPDPTTDTT